MVCLSQNVELIQFRCFKDPEFLATVLAKGQEAELLTAMLPLTGAAGVGDRGAL